MTPAPLMLLGSHVPVAIFAAHVLLATYLTFAVSRGLYRSYLELPPSQATRSRQSKRQKLVPVFAALALVSFAHATYTGVTYAVLSYRVWAAGRGIALPVRLWGNDGILPFRDNHTLRHMSRWLTDTPIYADAFEVVAEQTRRYWWGQQLDLAMLPWTLLLSIEGRRRNIPFTWAYLGLAHLVGLSFAQNLFYVALLLTPTPIVERHDNALPASWYVKTRDSIFPPKPPNWCPHPLLFLICYSFNGVAIFFVPSLAGTALSTRLLLTTRGLTFLSLLIPYIVPESWGTVHSHPHHAYSSFSALFRLLSTLSLALHGKSTLLALTGATTNDYRHRHSALMNIDLEKLAVWERTTYGLGRILGAWNHHPLVNHASVDVILSALSLGLWAAVRSIEAEDILSSSVPFFQKLEGHTQALVYETTDAREILAENGITDPPLSPSPEPVPKPRKRRTRPTKIHVEPPSTSEEEATTTSSPLRRNTRSRKNKSTEPMSAPEDAYVPTPRERAAILEGDVLRVADGELGWESAALAWGITVVGGLGCGSAGVFGAECVSR
ncbi:hypothetical protein jhhlp_000901 [Lomentospora prolificans]|uniref:Uncharacterized protein n=1 Tax=Lomentospora prolificans TaxID=41688 RepID=A0A2N3NJS2_9PEZI|nr:hypothetical protein jhhlp_000901 [Lomentospora prolificans]